MSIKSWNYREHFRTLLDPVGARDAYAVVFQTWVTISTDLPQFPSSPEEMQKSSTNKMLGKRPYDHMTPCDSTAKWACFFYSSLFHISFFFFILLSPVDSSLCPTFHSALGHLLLPFIELDFGIESQESTCSTTYILSDYCCHVLCSYYLTWCLWNTDGVWNHSYFTDKKTEDHKRQVNVNNRQLLSENAGFNPVPWDLKLRSWSLAFPGNLEPDNFHLLLLHLTH